MQRNVLPSDQVGQFAMEQMVEFHKDCVDKVKSLVEKNHVVVVGMAMNPFVKKAKKALTDAQIDFQYVEFGNYVSGWKPRLAIKLWSGWPTYPQVFVGGKLIGGYNETIKALKDGLLK